MKARVNALDVVDEILKIGEAQVDRALARSYRLDRAHKRQLSHIAQAMLNFAALIDNSPEEAKFRLTALADLIVQDIDTLH